MVFFGSGAGEGFEDIFTVGFNVTPGGVIRLLPSKDSGA